MSRIGNQKLTIPKGVQVKVGSKSVSIIGPKGTLETPIFEGIRVDVEGSIAKVSRANDSKDLKAKHGLVRALLANTIKGTNEGFFKNMVLQGVGYRASKKDKQLVLSLGFSHEILVEEPDDVSIEVPEPTKIKVSGIDKQRVGLIAAKIRAFRPPEPYKAKGIHYENEQIRRKAGKAGKK